MHQHNVHFVAVFAVIAAFSTSLSAESFAGTIIYSGSECSGTPLVVSVVDSVDCEAVECIFFISDSVIYSSATTCESTDRQTYVAEAYDSSSYFMVETFTQKCKLFMGAMAFLATGECQVYDDEGDNYVVAKVNEDGSASLGIYNASSCTGSPFLGYEPDNDTVSSHSCYKNYSVIYTSDGSSSSGADSQISAMSATNRPVSTSQTASNSGGYHIGDGFNGDNSRDTVGNDETGSQGGENATISLTPSGGGSTGAIVGILVAYVILCMAACILCMDRIQRFARRLGLRR